MKITKCFVQGFRTLFLTAPLLALLACGGGSTAVDKTGIASAPDYIKVCNNGENEGVGSCPKNPALGSKPEAWGCTSDTRTGLMWEVKTPTVFGSTNNLRDTALLYSNYDSTTSPQFFQAGSGGINGSYVNPTQGILDQPTNALGFAKQVNELLGSAALCGTSRWRLPSQTELESLLDLKVVSIPGTLQTPPVARAAINQNYFPNTNPSEPYASSTPTASDAVYKPLGYFTNNVSFKTFNQTIADQLQPYQRGGNYRAAVRLVADCKCKLVGTTKATRNWGRSVLLPDGSVLTIGEPSTTSFAERFNPATELWASAGQFTASDLPLLPSQRHSATLVGNKVVVIGGAYAEPGKKVWIYDSASQMWSMGADAGTRHIAHGAISVGNQKILVIGGDCPFNAPLPCASGSVEEYDAAADTWSKKSPMPVPLQSSSTTKLADGRILVAGGSDNFRSVNTAQIYDPATNSWSVSSSMNESRYYHTATLLKNGRVLVAGGNKVLNGVAAASKTAEIYDPATNVWSLVAPMSILRVLATATPLADGRVLVAGGTDISAGNTADSVEIYDPTSNTWKFACKLLGPRYGHNATLLADGTRILISGGLTLATSLVTAEIYTP